MEKLKKTNQKTIKYRGIVWKGLSQETFKEVDRLLSKLKNK